MATANQTRPAASTKVKPAAQTTATTPAQEQERMRWADFNSASFAGRVSHVEIINGQHGEYAAVTLITRLSDGLDGIAVVFNDAGQSLSLAKRGYLPVGRGLHVSGTIRGFESHYERGGVATPLQRGRIRLSGVTLTLGALPRNDRD